jgi:hypothetical protein
VFAYWAQKGEDEELTMEEKQTLVSTSCTAADDVIDMDDPIIRVNVGNMLRKIMQDSTGFVFSVHFDSQGLPDAFMYMTPRKRADIVQFGDVIFLDAQQCQFNSSGFPIFLQCFMTRRVRLLKEPSPQLLKNHTRSTPDQIWIIFANMGITNTLLCKLSIHKTCLLCCDY